jgi:hypothetical protein
VRHELARRGKRRLPFKRWWLFQRSEDFLDWEAHDVFVAALDGLDDQFAEFLDAVGACFVEGRDFCEVGLDHGVIQREEGDLGEVVEGGLLAAGGDHADAGANLVGAA